MIPLPLETERLRLRAGADRARAAAGVIPLPLETERLRLRAFEPEDVDALARVYLDPEVTRHVLGGVFAGRGVVRASLEREAELQRTRGYAVWAVVERATAEVVGDAGLALFEPLGELEVGYTLARAAWGRGYATEAARACVAAAFAHLDAERVVAVVDETNAASLRVAAKAGLTPFERRAVDGRRHVILERRRAVSA